MSEKSTDRPSRITAFVSLVDRLFADPLTAHLTDGGIWGVNRQSISLIHHADGETADQVLAAVGALLAAEFVPSDKVTTTGFIAYEAKGHWDGVRVSMTLFAPGQSAEEQLRARVAELEAELAAKPVKA